MGLQRSAGLIENVSEEGAQEQPTTKIPDKMLQHQDTVVVNFDNKHLTKEQAYEGLLEAMHPSHKVSIGPKIFNECAHNGKYQKLIDEEHP